MNTKAYQQGYSDAKRYFKKSRTDVLDEIRAEIIQAIQNGTIKIESGTDMLFRIIDLYKAESEE